MTTISAPAPDRLRSALLALDGLSADDMLSKAMLEVFAGRIAVVSSFGAESAVLLRMVAAIDPDIPVLFIDTGKHFQETLGYRDLLVDMFGLRTVIDVRPNETKLAERDPEGIRHQYDPDGCCELRKVNPLEAALSGYDAWISGRKRFHGADRQRLPAVEIDGSRVKLNPLADWGPADIEAEFHRHDLPRHPLWRKGYLSIGCSVCTAPAKPGEGPRSGRWSGLGKTECGIHVAPSKVA